MHQTVMRTVAVEYLNVKSNGIYVDATAGSGGHAMEILKKLGKSGKLILIDRDDEAIKRCRKNLQGWDSKVEYIRENFKNLESILKSVEVEKVDGILFDLGISREQIEDKKRGFSFLKDGYLDMRFDRRQKKDAFFVINTYSFERLYDILRRYGEERWAKKIASNIVKERKKSEIKTTFQLNDIILKSIPKKCCGKIHPSTRTFQALRMEVNDEIPSLISGINSAISLLKYGGRIVIISFHSGEDRVVKNILKENERNGVLKILNKKVIKPTSWEVRENPSSRSAKLRAGEKIII